uniref:Uncharacterized protein n=1 Tax=Ciona savignyi TaxID=51511 RepID=H2ZQY2_CIOSA
TKCRFIRNFAIVYICYVLLNVFRHFFDLLFCLCKCCTRNFLVEFHFWGFFFFHCGPQYPGHPFS